MPEPKLRQRHNNGYSDSVRTKERSSNSESSKKSKRRAAINAELKAATSSNTHRQWTRTVIIFAVMTLVYFYTKNKSRDTKFAIVRENLALRMQTFDCAANYIAEMREFPKCVPKKCGRFVTDNVVERKEELDLLLDLAQRILPQAGSSGGASILDIHTGALSYKEEFINVFGIKKLAAEFKEEHLLAYNLVKGKVKLAIAEQFGIPSTSLYLTYPTFFSRITNNTAKTVHDEYWHEHVDKETYPSFHYTSLLYLTTYEKDFSGGRFIFVDGVQNINRTTSTIEPKLGRVSAFTSGEENRHHVEKVTSGERYALTISFTCNEKFGISDPKIQRS